MHKIIFCSFILILASPTIWGQKTKTTANKRLDAAVSAKVNRTLVNNHAKHPTPWQTKLYQLQQDFAPLRYKYPTVPLPHTTQGTVVYNEESAYMQRLLAIQKLVSQNPALKGFQFATPVPYDLVHLITPKLEELSFFFTDTQTLYSPRTELVRPFTLAVRLGQGASALEIWIDVPTQKIYLMSDNLYSTAQGKYSVHLP